jgi:hypothetical protein
MGAETLADLVFRTCDLKRLADLCLFTGLRLSGFMLIIPFRFGGGSVVEQVSGVTWHSYIK